MASKPCKCYTCKPSGTSKQAKQLVKSALYPGPKKNRRLNLKFIKILNRSISLHLTAGNQLLIQNKSKED